MIHIRPAVASDALSDHPGLTFPARRFRDWKPGLRRRVAEALIKARRNSQAPSIAMDAGHQLGLYLTLIKFDDGGPD